MSSTTPVAAAQPTLPLPVVNANDDMASEPALTIGDIQKFLNATWLLVGALGLKFSADLPGAVDTWVQAAFGIFIIGYGIYTAKRQAEKTRAAVYSPATTQSLVAQAVVKGREGADTVAISGPPADDPVVKPVGKTIIGPANGS